MSKEPGYKTYDSVLTVEGMLWKTPPAELLQLLQALDSAKALSKVGLNASDLHFNLVEELEHLLCKDLKDQFSAQALEFMLCNAKATYTFDMLIPRVCSELYRRVGESHEALRVEFKHLTSNIATFIYGVMGAVGRFSSANLTSSPYRNKIRGIWQMMLDCVHNLRNHLPTAGDLSSLIGAPPTDPALKRRQDALKDHVDLFAVLANRPPTDVGLGDIVEYCEIQWVITCVDVSVDSHIASLKSRQMRNILNDGGHLAVGLSGAYPKMDGVRFVVECVHSSSDSCDVWLLTTTSIGNLELVEPNSRNPPNARFGVGDLVVLDEDDPPVREISKVSSRIDANPGCSPSATGDVLRNRPHVRVGGRKGACRGTAPRPCFLLGCINYADSGEQLRGNHILPFLFFFVFASLVADDVFASSSDLWNQHQ